MGLLSIFKRKTDASPRTPAATEPADEVLRARTRARQRLIGAAVLVVIGIVGFPLVFETQPRPIPVDIPIEIPRKDNAPPLTMPPARGKPAASAAAAAPADDAIVTEAREDSTAKPQSTPAAPASAPRVAETAVPKPATPPAAKPEPKPEAKPDPKPADAKPARPDTSTADSARAKALLEGKDAATKAESGGRFVVQVGAFADASAARETRQKAEKLGLKTYTQVASTASGNRIRVRIGPFASREEADRALAKAKGGGLTAVVLTL